MKIWLPQDRASCFRSLCGAIGRAEYVVRCAEKVVYRLSIGLTLSAVAVVIIIARHNQYLLRFIYMITMLCNIEGSLLHSRIPYVYLAAGGIAEL